MQLVRKFSISSPTSQRAQMPLSNIFSASTSNALYKPKIVMENNSATQSQKKTAAEFWSWRARVDRDTEKPLLPLSHPPKPKDIGFRFSKFCEAPFTRETELVNVDWHFEL